MKTLILAAAAALMSSAAFAQEAPQYVGDYSAATAHQFDASSGNNGQFMLNFSSSASATMNGRGDQADSGGMNGRTAQANYGATVDASDVYSGR